MRIAVAKHFPFIARRGTWPYRADFCLTPRASPPPSSSAPCGTRLTSRPEYADLWKTLPPDSTIPELDRTLQQ